MSQSLPGTQSSQGRSANSYNRRRASNACLVCRSRKTKCDNQRPRCGFCVSNGGNCRYVDSDHSQLDRSTLTILERISQLETSLINHISSTSQDKAAKAYLPTNDQRPGEPRDLHDYAYQAQEPIATSRPYEGSSTGSVNWDSPTVSGMAQNDSDTPVLPLSDDAPPSAEVLLRASEMSIESILKWPIFSEAAPHLVAALATPLIEIVGRPRPNNIGPPSSTLPDLSPDTINRLVQNFLNNNHIKNPVLDVNALWADAREFAESGPQWDARSCLLLLICAISTLSASLTEELVPGISKQQDRLSTAEAYFLASQRRIGMLCHENSFIGAQCSFLSAVYLMSTLRILAAWKCFVQAGSQCLAWLTSQGRMTRDHKLKATISLEGNMLWGQNENKKAHNIEESLYWSCLKSEMFHLRLPGSGLGEVDYPHLYPSPPQDIPDIYEQTFTSPPSSWPFSSPAQTHVDRQNLQLAWYFYLAEIAMKRILNNLLIWQYDNRPRGGLLDRDSKDLRLQRNVVEFERQNEDWYHMLPAQMKFPRHSDVPTNDILRLILRGHMIDVRDFVRFPALEEVLALNPHTLLTSFSSIQLRLTREYLEIAAESIEANRESFFHRHQGTWLMARTCTKSSLILLAMALRCQAEARSTGIRATELEEMMLPTRWRKAVEQTVETLTYWSDESNDLSRLNDLLRDLLHLYKS
ncbi:hypothetical protein N431DRAFT_356437 [Stipitochalara longipes BDJ]|nr:hypothetical protein N431DRAFT_356437 [Stipitochalara longipes BDJ]